MANTLLKTSFAAGELNTALGGRVDLAKYSVGAAVMRNFFVDYRGGASTRPGTAHVGRCRITTGDPKPVLIPFTFNSDQAYVLEINGTKMRVIYRGGYVLETARSITAATRGAQTVIEVPGHDYVAGDFIQVADVVGMDRPNGVSGVNTRTFCVASVSGSDVALADCDAQGGYSNVVSSTWTPFTTGGTAARVYEVATPWAADDLFALNYAQSADVLTVSHPDYPTYDIARRGVTNWTVARVSFGAAVKPPIPSVYAVNNDGSKPQYFFSYVVTAVDSSGRESNASVQAITTNQSLNPAATPSVTNRVSYAAEPGAYKYRIFKSQPVPNGQQGGGPYFYGLIGQTFDTVFTDVNFAPDYTQAPPQARNPFSDKGVGGLTVVTGGAGYVSPYLEITDATGSGAQIALITSNDPATYGAITGGNVQVAGGDYTAPVAVVKDAAPPGSGLLLGFSGAWAANPGGFGFIPAPGSVRIIGGGQNYHQSQYLDKATAQVKFLDTGAVLDSTALRIRVTGVMNGAVTSVGFVWPDDLIMGNPATGLLPFSSSALTTLVFNMTDGADAVASGAVVALTVGGRTSPACVSYIDQRRVFAGSRDKPATLWLSKPGQYSNFDVSDPPQADDAITAALLAQEVNIITSLTPVSSGLLALTSGGAYLVSGSAEAGITPTTIKAPPQTFSGAQALRPLRINDRMLYAQSLGSGVREISFNFYTNAFTGVDLTALSGHLLEGRKIVQWCYADEPHKIVWAVRDDGVLLSLTYLREQEVYGWARHDTSGTVVSVCTVPEGRESAVYMVVHRYCPGYGFRYCVERLASRQFGANPAANIPAQPELAWCVDGGAQYTLTAPNTAIVSAILPVAGQAYSVSIDAAGAGYGAPQAVIADLTGTGMVVSLVASGGLITGAAIVEPGEGYTSPVVTIRDTAAQPGSGGAVSVRLVNAMTFTFGAAIFSAADVGKVLRVRGGRGTVLSCPAANQLVVDMDKLPAALPNAEDFILPRTEAGEWTLTAPVSCVGGLDHLNGSTVQITVDGSVQAPQTVVDGCVALEQPGTCIIVGQGFTAQLQTMRLETPSGETVQGKRKTIPSVVVRAKDARGLAVGTWWDRLTEIKERTSEAMGEPTRFSQGGERLAPLYPGAPIATAPLHYVDHVINVETAWEEDGVVCVQQSYPLPATILMLAPDVLVGDNG